MTHRILQSAIAGIVDFPAKAAAHAVEMKAWRAHMARVKDDEAAGVTGIDKHWPLKRPSSHPLVEAAVNENDEMDFDLVDDGPTPEQVLRARKDALLRDVIHLEQAALAELAPFGKRRLLIQREGDILAAHRDRVRRNEEMAHAEHAQLVREHHDVGLIKSAASAIGLRKEPVMPPIVAPVMPPDDAGYVAEQAELRRRSEAIARAAAQAQHDIEDLTAETVDAWRAPDFKG